MSFVKITDQFNKNALANIYPKLRLPGNNNTIEVLENIRSQTENDYNKLNDKIESNKDQKE